MPPSHFVDVRLVRTNLDKEGLKFQLEEHAVARILEVWGLLGSHYHCESLLYNNMRWIKKRVFNLNCTSVLHVFKLSIDYEELLKETNQIPAVIIRCLQRVHKVRFTVVKAQTFLTLTYMIDWLHNFDFNFINHSNLKEDIWELVPKRKLQLSYPWKHFTFRPPDTSLRKNNVSSRNLKLPTRKR